MTAPTPRLRLPGERPLWRWWLFCLTLDLGYRFPYESRARRVLWDLMAWCVLPEWLGCPTHTTGQSSCWRAFDRTPEPF